MYSIVFVLFIASAVFGDDQTSSSVSPYDTIIVGLGPAGCTAASTLAQAGKRVLALEAQDRIGGRVHTVPVGDGVVELGAEWIHGTENSKVYDLAIKNNISVISQGRSMKIYWSDGTLADHAMVEDLMDYTFNISDYGPKVPEPFGQFATKRITECIKGKYPHVLEDKQLLNEILYFLDLTVDSNDATNSWNDLSTESNYETLGGDLYMSWNKHGYKTLFEILFNNYNNGPGYSNLNIKLKKEVTLISWPQKQGQPVLVTCSDGTVYSSNNVIVTVSLGVLKERHQSLFSPELPKTKVTAIEKMSMGVLDKIVLTFADTWWPSVFVMGLLWRTVDKEAVTNEDDWITKASGVSSSMGNNRSLEIWFAGESAKLVETLPEELLKTKIMGVLRRFIGTNKTVPEPESMLRSKWHANPFTRGSYTYDNVEFPLYPTARSDLGQPLEDSAEKPRVLFAGEATNPTHFSTVHGAVETGYREAMRLLHPSSIM